MPTTKDLPLRQIHMQRFLATPDREAYFDFLSLVVVLEQYESQHLAELQRAIAWEPGEAIDARTADFRALLKHEVTHFLDTTTTAWGGQYTLRKLRMLRKLQDDTQEFANADEVFALETGELAMHTALVETGPVPPASCDTIQHELVYRAEFGVCVLVHYLRDGGRCHKGPISMLSLLEANATASEYLSLIQCAESHEELVDRQLAMDEVHRRFEALLNDPERLEYSALLHLTRVHFKDHSLAEQLKLVAALARFSLDASTLTVGRMADEIQLSFSNRELGDMLAMELRRDSHRQLIFFKTVLFMYGWLHHMGSTERAEAEALVRDAPLKAIRRMWADVIGEEPIDDADFRSDISKHQERLMRELGVVLADSQIFGECSGANRALLETTSAGLLSFKELKLLNALLADEMEVVFPNCVDIRVPDYFNDKLDVFSKLDGAYREMKHERFHLPPGSPIIIRMG